MTNTFLLAYLGFDPNINCKTKIFGSPGLIKSTVSDLLHHSKISHESQKVNSSELTGL